MVSYWIDHVAAWVRTLPGGRDLNETGHTDKMIYRDMKTGKGAPPVLSISPPTLEGIISMFFLFSNSIDVY